MNRNGNTGSVGIFHPTFRRLFFLLFAFLITSCASLRVQEDSPITRAPWQVKKVASGVIWKYHHFENLFDSRQSITILEIDLDDIGVGIEHVDSGFFKTSARAQAVGAVAAVNGSFFDTKKGGSAVFFRKSGKLLNQGSDSPRAYRDNAGFAIDASGKVSIIRKPEGGWMGGEEFFTVLSSGPLLVQDGAAIPQVQEKFNTNRHPRTAIGLTKRGDLIAVVVDGRSADAYGMTTGELATLMQALGCAEAMNLDGGGSSTAWVRGEATDGVVNFPSDNKKFDRQGERAVSNCIVFFSKE